MLSWCVGNNLDLTPMIKLFISIHMFGIGGQELLLILILGLIILGPKRLPELARYLGKAMGELQRTADQIKKDIDVTVEPDDKNADNNALDVKVEEESRTDKSQDIKDDARGGVTIERAKHWKVKIACHLRIISRS